MNALNVLVDLIETSGIRPMPTKQMFETVNIGYQVVSDTVVIHRHEQPPLWLQCRGSQVTIIPRVVNKSLADSVTIDLVNPNSLEIIRSFLLP